MNKATVKNAGLILGVVALAMLGKRFLLPKIVTAVPATAPVANLINMVVP